MALVYWVKPLLPTTLDCIESLPLLGTDKILPAFDAIWVIQGALCFDKLRRALAQTLRDYPHVAGRLSCDPKTQEVRIRLTNDGVPITVGSTNLSYATDEWFHNNEHHPDLVDRLPMMSFHPSDEPLSQPLARFKITTWKMTGETSLSVAWWHILGDGTTLSRVMHAWSNYYQDLAPEMIPTFEKYGDPAPKIERQFINDTLTQVPHLGVPYSTKMFHEMFSEMLSTTSRVDIKLTLEEILAIRDMATKSTTMRVSTMDCLAAYFVTVLNRTEDVPIWEISNAIEVKHI
ncbi:hypothetical protein PILCRDRAFT_564103 [Piloderma croceum F 1598]|uniref:Condensation domain-containing protein n=1 Tax=Piloderma croceum (strain F 1598) TaxID=765440 RepID=A0A0C3F3H8_PILCF|nr:hypothetical protein PILCRDRAFT_564103 [Piloderma croceum F 1598]